VATEGLEDEIKAILTTILGSKGAHQWLNKPHERLRGIPHEMIVNGDGQKVVDFVHEWEAQENEERKMRRFH